MLHTLRPLPSLRPPALVPSLVAPLLAAPPTEQALTRALQDIVQQLGFTGFMVAFGATQNPTQETRAYVWTSLPAAWVRLYDEQALVECDPRLRGVWDSAAPLVWDQTTFPQAKYRRFLAAAAAHGVGSGLALPLCEPTRVCGIFSLSRPEPQLTPAQRSTVEACLGRALLLASYVYELFLAEVVTQCVPSRLHCQPLSPREQECLQLLAKGLRTREMGRLLGVGTRTVEFHVSNLLAKLGAANRREAVTRALAAQLVEA